MGENMGEAEEYWPVSLIWKRKCISNKWQYHDCTLPKGGPFLRKFRPEEKTPKNFSKLVCKCLQDPCLQIFSLYKTIDILNFS